MPCYTMQTMSVEFKADNVDLLKKALDALDWKYTQLGQTYRLQNGIQLDLASGTAELAKDMQPNLNELKRAYSTEAIRKTARMNNWTVSKKSATKGVFLRAY